jgi:hypothetical protein
MPDKTDVTALNGTSYTSAGEIQETFFDASIYLMQDGFGPDLKDEMQLHFRRLSGYE